MMNLMQRSVRAVHALRNVRSPVPATALVASLALGALCSPARAFAQHDMSMHSPAARACRISASASRLRDDREITRILEADSTTNWSTVNLEALRQHLIDMDNVTLRAVVKQRDVAGGMTADVTGSGAVVGSIQRMLTMHANMLDQSSDYHAVTEPLPDGVRFTVTAKHTGDAKLVARIRQGLGSAGLLTEGDHHARHHLALARGEAHAHER